jgi:hypothetical protein
MVSFAEIHNTLSARGGRYVLRETREPFGKLKADYISIREADGHFVLGFLPYEALDRLLQDGIVQLDGPYNQQDNLVYRRIANE